jgi:CRP/FNR family transcriptional regulator, cyclic AMP receptor protein
MNESSGVEVWANSVYRLGRSRLFAGTEHELVKGCAASFTLNRIAAGTTIVLDGDAELNVHVIRRGAVRLELRGGRDTVLVVARLRAGDVFGVETLLGERPHATFAVCTQQTTLLSAPAAALASAFRSSAQMPANVARILVRQLSGIATSLHGVRYAPLATRVYAVLESVALEHGVAVADGTLLDVALEADDVGALTRCSPDDAAAALFFLERDGRIRTNGSLITLLN